MAAVRVLCVALGILATHPAAAADSSPRVSLEVESCLDVSPTEVRRIVSIELRARVDRQTAGEPSTKVSADCHNPFVALRAEDATTGKSLTRLLDLGPIARSARARVLALSIVELVSASWTELRDNPTPILEPVGKTALPAERNAALALVTERWSPSRTPTTRVFLSSRFFLEKPRPLLGVSVAWQAPLVASTHLLLAIAVEHENGSVERGTATTTTASAYAGLSWPTQLSSLLLEGSGGARLGRGWIGGTPRDSLRDQGDEIDGFWGGPAATLSCSVVLWGPLRASLQAEVGYALWAMRGTVLGSREVALSGVWTGLLAGLSYGP